MRDRIDKIYKKALQLLEENPNYIHIVYSLDDKFCGFFCFSEQEEFDKFVSKHRGFYIGAVHR